MVIAAFEPHPPAQEQARPRSSPKRGHVKLTPLATDKLSAKPSSNVREQLAAAQYFEKHGNGRMGV